MHVLLKTTFVALLLGTSVAASAWADKATAADCSSAARRTELEGGGIGTVTQVTRKTEFEGGGVGTVTAMTHKTESEGGGIGTANQPTRLAEAAPCK